MRSDLTDITLVIDLSGSIQGRRQDSVGLAVNETEKRSFAMEEAIHTGGVGLLHGTSGRVLQPYLTEDLLDSGAAAD